MLTRIDDPKYDQVPFDYLSTAAIGRNHSALHEYTKAVSHAAVKRMSAMI
jgi:hypothetical protein